MFFSVTKNGKLLDEKLYTWDDCTFKTGSNCVIVRRDVFEVIQPEKGKKIKLNEYNKPGFSFLSDIKITVDGKDVILSDETIENIKKQLT